MYGFTPFDTADRAPVPTLFTAATVTYTVTPGARLANVALAGPAAAVHVVEPAGMVGSAATQTS